MSDTTQILDRVQAVRQAIAMPQTLVLSLDDRPILIVTREGDLIKGPGYEASGEEFAADLRRCVHEVVAAHRQRAEQAEAELARLKHLMH